MTLVLVGVAVLAFVAVRWYTSPTSSPTVDRSQSAQVAPALASIPASELESIGPGTTKVQLQKVNGQPLTGAGGRPQLLYVGAEYCPYCAAQRWPLLVALFRFGRLDGLGLTTSSSTDVYPNTPTLTFHGSSYASEHLDFVAVETADRQGAPLERLSPDQQALLQRYDVPPYVTTAGGIPFLDFGNRFVVSGAAFSPDLLQGMDHQQVVAALQDPSSPQARAVLGTANVFTAAICEMTGQRPADVCGSQAIVSIQKANGWSGP